MITYFYRALVMLVAIPFHEAAHAFVSWKLGDSTAKNMGRMTINPMAHFDPMGALCMIVAGVGWAKPVPTQAYRFRNPKVGMALTACAGPAANFLLAFVSAILYKIVLYVSLATGANGMLIAAVSQILYYMIIMNVSLAVFNLIPVPPFDGSRILLTFLPQKWYFYVMKYEQYIFVGMFLLLMVGVLDRPLGMLNAYTVGVLDRATSFVDVVAVKLLFA